jgi:hypothetical protein
LTYSVNSRSISLYEGARGSEELRAKAITITNKHTIVSKRVESREVKVGRGKVILYTTTTKG